MSQKGFALEWLNERFTYDNAARNLEVENALLKSIGRRKRLRIVDLGAGTGSNLLYFANKFQCDQKWILIEQDAGLCAAARERLQNAFATDYELLESNGYGFVLGNDSKILSIAIICDSFYRLRNLVDLNHTDLVMAAAVFDVLSGEQFKTLMNQMMGKKIFLFSTMNYSGMRFVPEGNSDSMYTGLYERHMLRRQDFGKAMGKFCQQEIETFFNKCKIDFQTGKSLWNLDPKAFQMHSFILGYMEKSVPELLGSTHELAQFNQWLNKKRELSRQEQLQIEIAHFDFFTRFPI